MTEPPRWSVAMCTYNGERFLAEQLASIAAQTLLPAELVVVDDASSDGTTRILAEFAKSAPFTVRVFELSENVGSTYAFERAVGETTFELIALCDQDDVWYPEKLHVMDQEFSSSDKVGMVFSNADMIDEEGRALGVTAWETGQVGFVGSRRQLFRADDAFLTLFWDCYVTGAAAAFRASHRLLILPFGELVTEGHQAWKIHDGWAAMLIAAVAEVRPIDRPLLGYRRHAGQQVGLTTETPPIGSAARRPGRAKQLWNFSGQDRRLRLVRDRLVASAPEEASEAIQRLEDEMEHLRVRMNLPRNPASRAKEVMSEHRRGGYSRYSQGLLGVSRDLVGF